MKFKYGSTRHVCLVGQSAIKIGRICWIRLCLWLVVMFLSKSRRQIFLIRYGPSFWKACITYLMRGLQANRDEYEYSQLYPQDHRVMPTRRKLLWGWIIVQERGSEITLGELIQEHPFQDHFSNPHFARMRDPKQFCRNTLGKTVLVDYGHANDLFQLSITSDFS